MHIRAITLAIATALIVTGCVTQSDPDVRADQPTAAPAGAPSRATTTAPAPPSPASQPPSANQAPAPAAPEPAAVQQAAPAHPEVPVVQLAVPPASTHQAPAAEAGQIHDPIAERDARISQEVRAGLTRDAHLARDSKNVLVVTRNGVVTLTGTVTADADRGALRSQAERVSGVVRVEDQLVVR